MMNWFPPLWILSFMAYDAAAQSYDYYSHVDMYYKFYTSGLPWYDAKKKCSDDGAVLAMPRDIHEAEVLKQIFQLYSVSAITNAASPDFSFLGFHDLFQEFEFVGINGVPIQYFYHKWNPGEPNDDGDYCVVMDRSAFYKDMPCGTPFSFFCQKDGITPKFFNDYGKCQSNDTEYRYFEENGKYYKLHTTVKPWSEARVICELECGHLAIINNVHEEQFLTYVLSLPENHLSYINDNIVYMGYHDMFKEGTYTTVLDQPLSAIGYTNWGPGEPSDTNRAENCIAMSRTGQILDTNCGQPLMFYCERTGYDSMEYYPEVNMFYKFNRQPLKWFDAMLKCAEEQSTLATPRSQKEIDVLVSIFSKYPVNVLPNVIYPNWVFVGFHDMFEESEFLSINDENFQYYYHKWNIGEPNSAPEDCVAMNRFGKYNDFLCDTPSTFFCQKPGVEERKLPAINYKCQTNDMAYVHAEGLDKCYKVHTNPKKWSRARETCVAEGGQLAVPRNKAEETFIMRMISDPDNKGNNLIYPDYVLIGFHDMYRDGYFVTVTDEDLQSIGYSNWNAGEPNGGTNENCAAMHFSGVWNDYPCNLLNAFVCEQPANLLSVQMQKGSVSRLIDYLKHIFGYV